jgi:hypothetical protein
MVTQERICNFIEFREGHRMDPYKADVRAVASALAIAPEIAATDPDSIDSLRADCRILLDNINDRIFQAGGHAGFYTQPMRSEMTRFDLIKDRDKARECFHVLRAELRRIFVHSDPLRWQFANPIWPARQRSAWGTPFPTSRSG